MDNKKVIASSLTDNELAQAFSELVAERWDNWDLSPFMALLVDTCAPSILPYLAEQFDVEGLQGFEIAGSEAQQRDLIKRSIALHKFMGTPWAIREACRTVGFPIIILEEGVTAIPGGPASPDDWARFRILIEADENRHITDEEARKLRLFVEFYKNARSQLVELGFFQSFNEEHLFRSETSARDVLDIITLSVMPNPLVLDPPGGVKKIYVSANAPWVIEKRVFDWRDGSGDTVTLDFTGTAGDSEITVTTGENTTANREITVAIKSTDGRTLGTFVIRQWLRYGNAYSRAYSNAYNTYPKKSVNAYSRDYNTAYNINRDGVEGPYLDVTPDAIWMTPSGDASAHFDIKTGADWRAKIIKSEN